MIGFFGASILRRILAALLSIFFVTYAGTATIVYSSVRASMLQSHRLALNQLAELKYQQLSGDIAALATDVTAWSRLDVMNDLVSGDVDRRVAKALEELKGLYGLPGQIYAFDAGGALIAASTETPATQQRAHIPTPWSSGVNGLRLLPHERDVFSGAPALVIELPVFGTFDRNFRTGTLVLTHPWTAVTREIAAPDMDVALFESDALDNFLTMAQSRRGIPQGRIVSGESVGHTGALTSGWRIVASQDEAAVTAPLRSVLYELVLLGALISVPIIFLGRLLSARLTAPIAVLTGAVREIAATDRLEARVPVESEDELGSLARSFNVMIRKLGETTRERERFLSDLAALNETLETRIASRTEELKAAVEAQKRLIGDISHEIKSPLARLSMALGLARRTASLEIVRHFDRMETEVSNVSALVSELLTLARLDRAAAPANYSLLDLGRLVGKIVSDAQFERPARAGDIILRTPAAPVMVNGNPDFLRRAIENVVRNALFYTPEGTPVEVTLRVTSGGSACIEVSDHGPGVPDQALPHLFEPFYRVDAARARETGGTGIGLSICERVLRLHSGSVQASHRDPHGLVIKMEIPLAARNPLKSRANAHSNTPAG
jgi:signal transduction histidine kinase